MAARPAILIVVENLPVPLDRRVWQEACALRDAGYEVAVICPKMRGFTAAEEVLEDIHIYRHWISEEAGGFVGFLGEYASALWGETRLAWKIRRRHRFKVIHLQPAGPAVPRGLAVQMAVRREGDLRRA